MLHVVLKLNVWRHQLGATDCPILPHPSHEQQPRMLGRRHYEHEKKKQHPVELVSAALFYALSTS